MQGRYISPEKNAIAQDWAKFVKKNLLPHDQVCEKCNMIATVDLPSDLVKFNVREPLMLTDNARRRLEYIYYTSGGIPEHEVSRVVGTHLSINCPGCNSTMKFTGDEHLPADLRKFLVENYVDVKPPKKRKINREALVGTILTFSALMLIIAVSVLWGPGGFLLVMMLLMIVFIFLADDMMMNV